jgi:ATP-dependent DNA ligase
VIAPERAAWRPMKYGKQRAADIADAVVEPLWEGIRTLAHLVDGTVTLLDDHGEDLTERFADVTAALVAATHAGSAVFDGYLTTQATESGEGTAIKVVEIPTAGQMIGQMFMGKSGEKALGSPATPKRREDASDVIAFVAVDLLEVDGTELLDIPLLERRRVLESVLTEGELIRHGIFVRPPASTWIVSWPSLGFSKMTYKAQNGRYRPGEVADDWAVTNIPRSR